MRLFRRQGGQPSPHDSDGFETEQLADLRLVVAQLLAQCGVSDFRNANFTAEFVGGETDAPFSDLAIDSLALMEICIAAENSFGVSFSPDQLVKHGSVGALVSLIHKQIT